MTIRIVTDSTADLEAAEVERHGITVVPLTIHFGSASYRSGVDISKDEFYERLPRSEVLPRTSQPSPAAFKEAYEGLGEAEGIVSVHIGSKMSGTANAARQAASLLAEGSAPVEVVDSQTASMGLGFAALAAAEEAEAGGDMAAVAEAARRTAARSRLLLFVDTLEYLQKGGRIGRARAFLGTLLKTKPVLEVRDGEVGPLERPRTRRLATERLFELTTHTPEPERIAILYGTTPEEAADLAARCRDALPGVEVVVRQCSPVIGVHTGPGAMGAVILRRA